MNAPFFSIDPRLKTLSDAAENKAKAAFSRIEQITEYNQQKVLSAYIRHQVSETHFIPTTGYGYGDRGRDALDEILADIMGAEDALIRHSIVSGTHAIAIALFAILRPGDTLLAATGAPYDTLEKVIGYTEPSAGSLAEYGVSYQQVDLLEDTQTPNLFGIQEALENNPSIKMVHIQRSRGYNTRPSLTIEWIERIIKAVRAVRSDVVVFVDNCYGEFVETIEPSDVGADMTVGSLIKNPGGGLAPIGGYIAGTTECVERCAYRLSAPGLGKEVGANLGLMTALYQGFFLAPTVTAGAEKGAIFAANLYEPLGFRCVPNATESRHDIIQAVELGSEEGMIAFCKGIQAAAPVDSFATPWPSEMPGYNDKVIMAAGAFVQGSSIELSADGPIRPPYAVYFQGGLTWLHAKLGILNSLQKMVDAGLVTL